MLSNTTNRGSRQHPLVALVVFFCCWEIVNETSFAQESSFKRKRANCIEQINEQTAAFVAQDWQQLDRLAQKYLSECRTVMENADLSSAYEHIATVKLETQKPSEALTAADSCLKTYYSNSGCHILRVEAFIMLKQESRAREALNIADRLARHNLDRAEKDRSQTPDKLEEKLFEAKIKEYQAQLNTIRDLRLQLSER